MIRKALIFALVLGLVLAVGLSLLPPSGAERSTGTTHDPAGPPYDGMPLQHGFGPSGEAKISEDGSVEQELYESGSSVLYAGGAVMRDAGIYALYLNPSNSGLAFDPTYQSLINQYLTDVTSVGSGDVSTSTVLNQYSSWDGKIGNGHFAGAYNVTQPINLAGCTDEGTTECLGDGQIISVLSKFIRNHHLPRGLGAAYMVMLPEGMGNCSDAIGSCAYHGYCAYHSASNLPGEFSPDSKQIIYATIPYAAFGTDDGSCDLPSHPNGNPADATIHTLSHELTEIKTDPLFDSWMAEDYEEIADICQWQLGPDLGQTATGSYNQLIHGHPYEAETVWSNQTHSCVNQGTGSRLPKLRIQVNHQVIRQGESVRLAVRSLGGHPSYEWQMLPNAYLPARRAVSHVFRTAGDVEVRLIVTLANGNVITSHTVIHVLPRKTSNGLGA